MIPMRSQGGPFSQACLRRGILLEDVQKLCEEVYVLAPE